MTTTKKTIDQVYVLQLERQLFWHNVSFLTSNFHSINRNIFLTKHTVKQTAAVATYTEQSKPFLNSHIISYHVRNSLLFCYLPISSGSLNWKRFITFFSHRDLTVFKKGIEHLF